MTTIVERQHLVAAILERIHPVQLEPEPQSELEVLRSQVRFLASENEANVRRMRLAHRALGWFATTMFVGGCLGWVLAGLPHEDGPLFFLPLFPTVVCMWLVAVLAPLPPERRSNAP